VPQLFAIKLETAMPRTDFIKLPAGKDSPKRSMNLARVLMVSRKTVNDEPMAVAWFDDGETVEVRGEPLPELLAALEERATV
jgi:hypothetical protein